MFQYYLFNKPYQVLSQFSKEGEKETLADYLVDIPKDVYPVGRLDYDSEGLLLLTNDKRFNALMLQPRFSHTRTYWVQVEGLITKEALESLAKGVFISIEGKKYFTKKAVVSILPDDWTIWERNPPIRFRKNSPTSWFSLTLIEGKNRQVRKMTATVGFPTLRLVRAQIGKIKIDDLVSGKYRNLTSYEIEEILKIALK